MTPTNNHDPAPGFLDRTLENLAVPLRTLAVGTGIPRVHSGAGDILVAALFAAFALVAVTVLRLDAAANAVGILVARIAIGDLALWMAAAIGVAAFLGAGRRAAPVLVALLYAFALGLALGLALSLAVNPAGTLARDALLFAPPLVLSILLILNRLDLGRGLATTAALTGAVLLTGWYADPAPLIARLSEPDARPLAEPDTEAVYNAQPALLAAQTTNLRAGIPGQVDLFAILGAGDPTQRVFAREVAAVADILRDRYDAEHRILRLVNDARDPTAFPLLNRTNLQNALSEIARHIQPEEDILFLFLTSHGGPDHLSTRFPDVATRDLTPDDLKAALDASGVVNAVIVISACYSGSFLDELAGETRLIVTAAAPDRNSFGCRDQNEWTDWGRAFFAEALADTRDFRVAARLAQEIVATREAEEGLQPSKPMIVEGNEIGLLIDRLAAGR